MTILKDGLLKLAPTYLNQYKPIVIQGLRDAK